MQKSQNLGSFTLGPTWVNPLELANVAATLASHGKWCPPTPIDSITDREGKPVSLTQQACEQVVDPGLADTLAVAMSKDDAPGGTSFGAASAAGWKLPMSGKTGTTESHMSSASSASPTTSPRASSSTVTPPLPARSAPARCARVGTATCTAVPNRPARGSTR